MKHYALIIAMLLSLSATAQKTVTTPVEYALIKGHIKNNNSEFLDYGSDNYLDFAVASITIDKDGNFSKKIRIDAPIKEIYLETGTGIILPLKAKDTVELEWDANNFDGTLAIKTPNPLRATEFQKAFKQRLFSQKSNGMRQGIYEPQKTDSAKFEEINDFYNAEMNYLLSGDTSVVTPKMVVDIYFDYTKLLWSQQLLPKYELFLKKTLDKPGLTSWLTENKKYKPYKVESEEYFKISSNYRNFLFDYVRYPPTVIETHKGSTYTALSSSQRDYYSGLSTLVNTEMREWFVTKSIMLDFQFYPFADATEVYKDFITKVKTTYYGDTLKTFYANIQRLKPGSPAPVFTLKNEEGKTVSLSDFKGKNVYIDFWGVGCGPCVYAIKNEVPSLHERYKDKNIVFVNICVDSDEKQWKESIKNLKLTGINLHAEGWTKHPVCKAYNVTAIPHYYLLNQEGKIVNNNSQGASKYVYPDLDKLLKQ
ncbi:MAG: Peroxiredoxin [Mucilaginibacter sp.]|nr:Peroxiredoxin [Mucilaginibacter sp.]